MTLFELLFFLVTQPCNKALGLDLKGATNLAIEHQVVFITHNVHF